MGNILAFLTLTLPNSKPHWTADDIPDLTGKMVVVTGGNRGIGKETARAMLQRGAKVYLACRSCPGAEEAILDLRRDLADGAEVLFIELDLADLASVRRCAQEFLDKEARLHILFNNAGIAGVSTDLLTPEGIDLHFGTNVVGPWLLTELLTPALLAASDGDSSPSSKARVVTGSSGMAYLRALNFAALAYSPQRRKISSVGLYIQSKYGSIVVAKELARRRGDKIVSISLHPGTINSGIDPNQLALFRWLDSKLFHSADTGALTSLYAGCAAEAAELNGQFLVPWGQSYAPPAGAHDPVLGERLWAWLEEKTGHPG